jgi:hypothetical protein
VAGLRTTPNGDIPSVTYSRLSVFSELHSLASSDFRRSLAAEGEGDRFKIAGTGVTRPHLAPVASGFRLA